MQAVQINAESVWEKRASSVAVFWFSPLGLAALVRAVSGRRPLYVSAFQGAARPAGLRQAFPTSHETLTSKHLRFYLHGTRQHGAFFALYVTILHAPAFTVAKISEQLIRCAPPTDAADAER